MSIRCAVKLLSAQRFLRFSISLSRNCAIYPGYVFKQKPVSLNDQSVLLPGNERIRASKFLENPHEPVSNIPCSPNIKTVFEVLHHGLEVSGDGECCGARGSDGKYKWLRYSEVISKSQYIGSGLIELGIQPRSESCVGVFGVNREEFLLTLFGCSAYSMVVVPLYKSIALDSIYFIVNQAKLPLVIVNSVENALNILWNIKKLPSLRTLIMMDSPTTELRETAKGEGIHLITFQELEALGKAHKKDVMLPKPDDVFCIPYTSGTTGTPKGVMLTHGSLISYIGAAILSYGEATHYGGTIVSYLPPSHIYEIINNVATTYFARRIAFYSGDVKLLMEEVRQLQPTVLPLVPRIMNAIYAKVMENIQGNYFKSSLLKIALWRKEKLHEKGKVLQRSFWDKVVFREFQKALGGNVRVITTSSAPVPFEVMNFFRRASGAYIFEAYGQTEVLAATKTLRVERHGGHVGPPIPNNHVKVVDVPEMGYFAKDDMGEVCVKGPAVFKGYFKNEKATAESLRDGWQYTGDIGKWLPNGALQILDRKKHLFKLSQGEYIAPEKVENAYSRLPLVLQIFVDGFTDQDYIVALVVPEMGALKQWMDRKGYKTGTEDIGPFLSDKKIRTEFLKELRQVGSKEDLNSLEQGNERIRSSQLLENPNELVAQIPGSPEIETVFQVLEHGRRVSGDGDCVGTKIPNSNEYKWLKYSEVISKSQHIGSGLIQLGLSPCNDTFVGIYAANREEFLLTLYACSGYSMVLVPLYVSFGLQSLLFIINQANLSVVIVNNAANALKVLSNAKNLPSLHTVVIMDQPTSALELAADEAHLKLLHFSELEVLGQKNKKELVLPQPDDLFCIPYTSGTTGTPKGVMLTHKNMISCVSSLVIGYGDAGVFGGTIMSLLPPAHIYEIANEVCSLYFARRIAFYSDDIKKVMDEVRLLKPAILPFVPRLLNAIYTNVMESTKSSYLKTLLLKTALRRKEKIVKSGQVMTKTLWDKLVLKKFQDAIGGNCRMLITTSAPLSPEVMRFYRNASSSYVFEVYGQTEMLAATMTLPQECDGGFVGPPLPCNFVKLVDVPEMGYYSKDNIGEVCIKGPNVFKGYYKNEEATKESIIDGWQHTGDVGKWLPNGALKIVDRKKHLFKLSQGEYIAPERVENVYNRSKLVLQIFVDGLSDKDYIVVLVVPEPVALQKWLKCKGHQQTEDVQRIFSNKEVRTEFLKELREIGKSEDLNRLEQARNLAFLPDPFTIENELLTPTFKVRRKQASKHYEAKIRQLYEEGPLL